MIKFRTVTGKLYPNPNQKEIIDLTFKMCKSMYNKILSCEYENYNKYLKLKECNISSKDFFKINKRTSVTMLKKEDSNYKLVDSLALQYEEKNIFNAFNNYFHTSAKNPKYKKITDKNCYTTRKVNNNISITDRYIKLPKLGMIRIRGLHEKYLNMDICIVKVYEEEKGKYYATIILKETNTNTNASKIIDFDLKYDNLFTYNNNNNNNNNLHTLRKLEKTLTQKVFMSNSYKKTLFEIKDKHKEILYNNKNKLLTSL